MAAALMTALAGTAPGQGQYRGVYIPTFDTNTEARSAEAIQQILGSNINQVFVQVRARADSYYYPNREDSTYPNPDPRGQLYTIVPGDLDILQYYIDRCHNATPRREVIAWLTTFNTWNRPAAIPASPSHVFNTHPEWVTEDRAGVTFTSAEDAPLDPGIPGVQDYVYNVFMDVVRNYDVDGVHFDYIRLINSDAGFDPATKAQFLAETGWNFDTQNTGAQLEEVYEAWRRDQISQLVQRVHNQTRLEKPWVDSSAFLVNFDDSVEFLGQGYNWWVANNAIDILYPGCYSSTVAGTMDDWNFYVAKLAQNGDQFKRPLVCAIGSYLFLDAGDGSLNLQAVNALEANARKPDGYVFFAKGALFDDGTPATQLAQDLFNPGGPMATWADVPPVAHKIALGEETVPPNAPAGAQVALVDGVPRVTFARPSAAGDGDLPVHYRLYRDTKSAVDLYYSNMLMEWWDLESARSSFTFDDVTAGSATTHYSVVAYDNWNNQARADIGPVSVSGGEYIIETRAGGKNLADYSEVGSFGDSNSQSSAPGTTPSIGSRFALPADVTGRNDRARFTPGNLPTGRYSAFVTSFNFASANALGITSRFNDAGGERTTTIDLTAANAGNGWFPIGTLDFQTGAGHFIEFDNATQTNLGGSTDSRMNASALRLVRAAVAPQPKEPKPPVVAPGSPVTEVIVDSTPQALNYDDIGTTGNWQTSNLAGYFGGNARFFSNASFPFDAVSVWIVDLPRAGNWAIDGWVRNNTAFARGAQYRFVDGNGVTRNTAVTQRTGTDSQTTGGWFIDVDGVVDQNSFRFAKGRVYVSIHGNTTGNETLIADALRFRLIRAETSPENWNLF